MRRTPIPNLTFTTNVQNLIWEYHNIPRESLLCTYRSIDTPKIRIVMAASSKPVGYECEYVDQVPEDYFCKQCKHVATESNITSCCTEVLCKVCLNAVIEDKLLCPSCENTNISTLGAHKKCGPKILALKAYCLLRDCGCEWNGRYVLCEVKRSNIGRPFNIGYSHQFISHSDLEWNKSKKTQYLKNDCLKFRVTNIHME